MQNTFIAQFVHFRPLFSSLLYALPKPTWIWREDEHECKEAAYIAEVEENLLYNKGQMVIHLFRYFLHTQTGLSTKKIDKASYFALHNFT